MKLVLKNVRMAFPELFEPKAFGQTGDAACSGMFLFEFGTENFQNAVAIINQVATEKWGAKAADVLKTLKAKGDVCLHDGATKAEYEGFEGNLFISARNKTPPAVLAKQRLNGKPIEITRAGRAVVDGKPVDNLPFKITVPYSGCRVNVSLDVWAQDNQYGKRINAKLLAVQFEDDDKPFSGGEGFAATDFESTSENVQGDGGAFDDFGGNTGGDAGFFNPAPAQQPAASGFNFGATSTPAQASGFFGAAPAPAPAATPFW